MRIIFAGTPDFAVPSLQALLDSEHEVCAVYTQPDRPAGRGRKLTPSPVKALALQAGVQVFQPENLKHEQDVAQLRAFNADLMVVVAFGMILSQQVLDIPKLGCINVHGSLLPKWRGAAPIQRSLIAGDKETGVTIMRMVKKLDAGDMLHKEVYTIAEQDTASDLHDKLAELGAVGLLKVLPQIEQGTVQAEVQDESLVTYAAKLEKAEAVLDWSQSAADLALKVRGFNAWPVAQTLYQDQVLRIWQAEPINAPVDVVPGTVRCVQANKHKTMDVATAEGWLRLLLVQLPGGKRMDVQAFLNAHDADGVQLG